jgi:hypothetical protein
MLSNDGKGLYESVEWTHKWQQQYGRLNINPRSCNFSGIFAQLDRQFHGRIGHETITGLMSKPSPGRIGRCSCRSDALADATGAASATHWIARK